MRRGLWLLLVTIGLQAGALAGIVLDFEGFADSTTLTNQYTGLVFTNTEIVTAGLSLNDAEFPPHSGTNVATDLGGPISITFSAPVLSFSAFFTYSSALTINAFDSLNNGVGTSNSAFGSNFTSSTNPPNEFLGVAFAGGISRVSIVGAPGGSSFVLDDATLTTPGGAVPEPSGFLMTLSGLVVSGLVGAKIRGRFAVR